MFVVLKMYQRFHFIQADLKLANTKKKFWFCAFVFHEVCF